MSSIGFSTSAPTRLSTSGTTLAVLERGVNLAKGGVGFNRTDDLHGPRGEVRHTQMDRSARMTLDQQRSGPCRGEKEGGGEADHAAADDQHRGALLGAGLR